MSSSWRGFFRRVPLQILQKSWRLNQVSTRLETKHSDAFLVLTVPSTSELKGLAQILILTQSTGTFTFFFLLMHQSFWLAVVGLMSPDLLLVHFLISPSFSEISPKFLLDLRSPSWTICFELAGNPTPEAFWLSGADLLPFAVRERGNNRGIRFSKRGGLRFLESTSGKLNMRAEVLTPVCSRRPLTSGEHKAGNGRGRRQLAERVSEMFQAPHGCM